MTPACDMLPGQCEKSCVELSVKRNACDSQRLRSSMRSLYPAISLVVVLLLCRPPHALVNADILFGQSCALTGPAADLGIELSLGIRAAFDEINALGGVRGHNLTLLTLDDRYEPVYASNNTRALVEGYNVFGMLGSVGTPTSQVAMPIAVAAGVPFIGAFTGAQLLRDPHEPLVINVRASYYDETAAMIDYLVNTLLFTRVSLFVQNDSFGQTGYDGAKRALTAMKLPIESEGRFERNTLDVEAGLASIVAPGRRPQAIIMVGTYAPLAKFVKLAKRSPLLQNAANVIFLTVSFVGSNSLRTALGNDTANVIITEVVPLPTDMSIPIVANYRRALAQTDAAALPSHGSLEGYITGRFVASVLDRVSPRLSLTRKAFLDIVYGTSVFLVDDISMGPYRNLSTVCPARVCRCNQGMKDVWAVRVDNSTGNFIPLDQARFKFYDTCFSNVADLKYPLVFAQTAPFTAISPYDAAIAAGYAKGVVDAFTYTNDIMGGVFGHRLHLLTADDKGIRDASVTNVQKFVTDNINIFGILGTVGSASTAGVAGFLDTLGSNIGVIGPHDAEIAPRTTFARRVVYTLASHRDEARAAVDFAVRGMQSQSFSIISARVDGLHDSATPTASEDAYHLRMQNVATAVTDALGNYGITPKRLSWFHNSADIDSAIQLSFFRDGGADAYFVAAEGDDLLSIVTKIRARASGASILVGSYAKPTLTSIGSASSSLLDNIYIADGLDTSPPSVAQSSLYMPPSPPRSSLANVSAQAHTEGWITGRLAVAALERSYIGQPTPAALMIALYSSFEFAVDGIPLGPLVDGTCDASSKADCQCNQAAGQAFVYSITRDGYLKRALGYEFMYASCGVENRPYVSPYDSHCASVTADSFTFADDYSAALFVNANGVRFEVAMIVIVVVVSAAAAYYTVTRPRVDFLQGRPNVPIIRRSLANYLNTLSIIVETFQLTTMVFAADLNWSVLQRIRRAFDAIGLQYEFSWHYYAMLPLASLWIAYSFVIWTGASRRIRQNRYGALLLFPVQHLLPLMGTIGYIPAVLTMLESFACVYTSDARSLMDFDCSMECWTAGHWTVASFGVIVMLLFVPMAIMTAFFWQELQLNLDVKFRPRFFVADYLIKLFMCILRVFFYRFAAPFLSTLLVLNGFLCVVVITRRPSCVPWINDVKAWAYAMTVWTALIGLISYEAGGGGTWPQLCVFLGWIALIVFTIAAIFKRHPQLFVKSTWDGRDRLRKITWLFGSLKRTEPRSGSPSLSKRSGASSGHIAPINGEISEEGWALLTSSVRKRRAEGLLSDKDADILEKACESRDPVLSSCYARCQGSPSDLLVSLRRPLMAMVVDEIVQSGWMSRGDLLSHTVSCGADTLSNGGMLLDAIAEGAAGAEPDERSVVITDDTAVTVDVEITVEPPPPLFTPAEEDAK